MTRFGRRRNISGAKPGSSVATGLLTGRIHAGFLVDLPGDAQDLRIIEQVEQAGDVVDPHVIQRPTAGDLLLNKGRSAIAIHVWTPAPAMSDRAGMIEPAEAALLDQEAGGPGLAGEQGIESYFDG